MSQTKLEIVEGNIGQNTRFEGFALDDPNRKMHKMPVKPHFPDAIVTVGPEGWLKKRFKELVKPKRKYDKSLDLH